MPDEYLFGIGQACGGMGFFPYEMLEKRNVRCVAVVALLGQETERDDQAIIGYHNMALEDKEEVISLVKRDVIKKIVKENLEEWLKEMEGDG